MNRKLESIYLKANCNDFFLSFLKHFLFIFSINLAIVVFVIVIGVLVIFPFFKYHLVFIFCYLIQRYLYLSVTIRKTSLILCS